jgi:hypothetical protein
MDRTTSNLIIHSFTTDPTRINRIFVQMMDMPEFCSALDAWTHSEGLMLQSAVVGDAMPQPQSTLILLLRWPRLIHLAMATLLELTNLSRRRHHLCHLWQTINLRPWTLTTSLPYLGCECRDGPNNKRRNIHTTTYYISIGLVYLSRSHTSAFNL